MLTSAYGQALRDLLESFPVVTLLGPRQCGKTTFIRQALPDWTYLDLERDSDAAPFRADPEARFEQLGARVILDEAQAVPALFPILRGVVDRARKKNGRFEKATRWGTGCAHCRPARFSRTLERWRSFELCSALLYPLRPTVPDAARHAYALWARTERAHASPS